MISSVSNERVKNVILLQKKARARREQDCFVVEGVRMAGEVETDRLLEAFVSESFLGRPENEALCARLHAEVVSERVMAAMSDTQAPQGIIAVVRRREADPAKMVSGPVPLILMLERLQDPGNLGTILRTGEGAGVTGVLMSEDTVDIYNPKVIRSTMGSIYRVPFAYVPDLRQTARELKERGVCLYAAHLAGENSYDQENYRGATAFMIGNEGAGLSDELTGLADRLIRIPMEGQVESLNAAVSAAILMYEAGRQRRKKNGRTG